MFEIGSEDIKRGLERKLWAQSRTNKVVHTTRSQKDNYTSQEEIAFHFREGAFLELQPFVVTQARASKTNERKEELCITYEHSFFIQYHENARRFKKGSVDVFERYLTIISNRKNEWWTSRKYNTRKYYKLDDNDRKNWLLLHAPMIQAVNTLKRLRRCPLDVKTLHGKIIIYTDYKHILAEATRLLKTRKERIVKRKTRYKTRPMNLDDQIIIHAATAREISQ